MAKPTWALEQSSNSNLGSTVLNPSGTVSNVVGTGPWTAKLSGLASTAGIKVDSTLSATYNGGDLYGGAPISVTVKSIIDSSSLIYTVAGGTAPVLGDVIEVYAIGTFKERVTLNIDLLVSDEEDRRNLETDQFLTNVDHYATDNYVYIMSNGLATTPWIGEPSGYDTYSPQAQSYVFSLPALNLPLPTPPFNRFDALGFIGVAVDGVPFKSPNSGNITKYNDLYYTENSVINPRQDFFIDGSGIIGKDKKFYYQSDPTRLYTKNPTQHSPIVGFAFDGLPIYGPYGKDDYGNIRVMRSSYRLKDVQRANHTVPDGSFIEDYEYVAGLGDLDQYNTRDCITPEYPGGVRAYFITVDPDRVEYPVYPYIVGPKYFETPITPNGNFDWPGIINIEVISGALPAGLRIAGNSIVGTPYEVSTLKKSRFVLRAYNLDGITDRTFEMYINGANAPVWKTPAGLLEVGTNHSLYVLDNSLVDFQFSAVDRDSAAGQNLTYYIPPKGGIIPPGLSLSASGRLYGFTDPLFSNDAYHDGNYDMNLYDQYPYDYGVRPDNGFDTFLYDYHGYDYHDNVRTPKKLNRYYEFVVRASDGVFFTDRKFRIFLVGDDHLRADNTIMQVGNGVFTADSTYLRRPIWITPSNLGRKRANNYVTVFLDIFDPSSLQGPIEYLLASVNDDGSPSILPPGMKIDQLTGEIYGSVPPQSAITVSYKFTVRALRYDIQGDYEIVDSYRTFTLDIIGEIDSTIRFVTDGDLGTLAANFISTVNVEAFTNIPGAVLSYSLVSGTLPYGLTLFNDGTLQGKVNQYGTDEVPGLTSFDQNTLTLDKSTTTIGRDFMFTIEARDQFNLSAISKTFKLSIITPNDLLYSNIYVKPFLPVPTRVELSTFLTDDSVFEVNKLYRPSDLNFGVQTELKMLLYPGIETKEAADYAAALGRTSKKRFRIGIVKKSVAKIPTTNTVLYEVIYLEIIDNLETGMNSVPKVIPTRHLNYPISVNQGRRDIIDSSITNNNRIEMAKDVVHRLPKQDKVMSADFGGQRISDSNKTEIYGNSTTNIRRSIQDLGDTERNYLPLWMRTPQTNSGIEQGFTKAIPLCYCLPGQADSIILNIKNAIKNKNFDFKKIDFTVDRIIIDSVEGQNGDKYIAFAAREVING